MLLAQAMGGVDTQGDFDTFQCIQDEQRQFLVEHIPIDSALKGRAWAILDSNSSGNVLAHCPWSLGEYFLNTTSSPARAGREFCMTSNTVVKQSLQLVERLTDGSIRHILLTDTSSVPARPGAQYALIDTSTGKSPEGLQVKRKGSSLIVELECSEALVEITDFYDEPETAFIPQAELEGSTLLGVSVTSETPVIETAANGDEIIWRGSNDGEL